MTFLLNLMLFSAIFIGSASESGAQEPKQDILVAFEMKGGFLSFDVGVLEQLYPRLAPEKIGTTIFTGSSSGSVLTAYFACNGLNPESIRVARTLITAFTPEMLGETDTTKIVRILTGLNVDKDIRQLDSFLLGITKNGTCLPTTPFAIISSNDEILSDTKPGTFHPANTKRLNFDTLDVFEIASGLRLGKACTYFTNTAGAQYLSRVPAQRRLCDIRLVTTPADLLMAIRASVAEPTYYAPVAESDPSKFLEIAPPVNRRYRGGMIMQAAVQDFKIASPDLLTIGIGGTYHPRALNRFLKNLYLMDVNQRLLEMNWWYDVKFEGTRVGFDSFDRSTVKASELMAFGRATVAACIDTDSCNGTVNLKPEAASKALDGSDLTPLTHRGIKAILHN
jgi:hypothetical protein